MADTWDLIRAQRAAREAIRSGLPENNCPVCKPYSKAGYQEQTDGPAIPCFACNRAEFEKLALSSCRMNSQED